MRITELVTRGGFRDWRPMGRLNSRPTTSGVNYAEQIVSGDAAR